MKIERTNAMIPVFANSNDALIPELWAQESLMVLEERLLMGNLVYRDYNSEVARFGDTVNYDKPSDFELKRKVDGDNVTVQDARTTGDSVKLNQWGHVSFIIYDGEESMSFQRLRNKYLERAVRAMAEGIDSTLLAQKYQFMDNTVGKLGTDITKSTAISLTTKMDELLFPTTDRYCIASVGAKTQILNIDDFTQADKIGDGGQCVGLQYR